MPKSKNNPSAFQFDCQGIEDATNKYIWKSVWMTKNQGCESCNWSETKKSLGILSQNLRKAIAAKDLDSSKQWALAILKWGGVKGALNFINTHSNFPEYLTTTKKKFTLSTAVLGNDFVEKMDSGLTKIHSLMSEDGLAIVDARVLAAMGLLVTTWLKQNSRAKLPRSLHFGHLGGAINPKLNRKPEKMSNIYASKSKWVDSIIKISWIIEKILTDNETLFGKEGNLPERMQAFQAGLFMIGYNIDDNDKDSYNKKTHTSAEANKTIINSLNNIVIRSNSGTYSEEDLENLEGYNLEMTEEIKNFFGCSFFKSPTLDSLKGKICTQDNSVSIIELFKGLKKEKLLFTCGDGNTSKYNNETFQCQYAFPNHKWIGSTRNQANQCNESYMAVATTGHGLTPGVVRISIPYNIHINILLKNPAALLNWLTKSILYFAEEPPDGILFHCGGCPIDQYKILIFSIASYFECWAVSYGKSNMGDVGKHCKLKQDIQNENGANIFELLTVPGNATIFFPGA